MASHLPFIVLNMSVYSSNYMRCKLRGQTEMVSRYYFDSQVAAKENWLIEDQGWKIVALIIRYVESVPKSQPNSMCYTCK